MIAKNLYRITFVFLAFTIAGCTAFALRDANDQLTTYYYAKVKAQQDAQTPQDNSFILMESALASLKTLAENASAQAKQESNVLNKISFYRIATTAAWQAGDTNVVSYSNAGQALCNDGNASKAPRDCGMLVVIPVLASVDEQTNVFNALQKKVTAPTWQPNETDTKAAETIYDRYSTAFNKLMQQRALLNTGAPPEFLDGVDKNLGALLCTHIDDASRGLLGLVGSSQLNTLDADVKKMKCGLIKANVNSALARCISSIQPQDCD